MIQKDKGSEIEKDLDIDRVEADRILSELPKSLTEKSIAYLGPKDSFLIDALTMRGGRIETLENQSRPLPILNLPSKQYDFLLCIDVIANLKPKEQRLLLMEIARVIKEEGKILISSSLDFKTEDPAVRLANLIQTECVIEESAFFNERLYYSLHHILTASEKFIESSKDPRYRAEKIASRKGFARRWFQMNSVKPLLYIWRALSPVLLFLKRALNRPMLEKVSHLFYQESGISYALFLAKVKPVIESTEVERIPKFKEKKWE